MKKGLCLLLCAVLLMSTACAVSYNGEFTAAWFMGRWVKNGDADGLTYVVHKDGYTVYDAAKNKTVARGSWEIREELVDTLSGGKVKTLCAVLTDSEERSLYSGILRPDDSGMALYQFSGNTFYIRENVLGKQEGKRLLEKYRIVRAGWLDRTDFSSGLYFDMDGTLARRLFDSNGAYKTESIGSWSVTEKELTVTVNGSDTTYNVPAEAVTVNGVSYTPQYKE